MIGRSWTGSCPCCRWSRSADSRSLFREAAAGDCNRPRATQADRRFRTAVPRDSSTGRAERRNRRLEIQNEIRAHTVADGKYLQEAERILDLAQRAHAIYMEEDDNFRRRELIDLVVSKVVISDKRALPNLWEPFSAMSKMAVAASSPNRRSMVGRRGFEPLTSCVSSKRSSQLS